MFLWHIRLGIEYVSPNKIIGTSLNLTVSTEFCQEKLIGLNLITFSLFNKTKLLLI